MSKTVLEMVSPGKCTGCECCVNACEKDALEMREDSVGFRYPFLLKERCTRCGACTSKCPVLADLELTRCKNSAPRAIAGYVNDESLVQQSSSGGFFGLIARRFLEHGGIVVAAAWGENFCSVEHTICECIEDLPPLQKSKYIQSRKGKIYRQAIQLLKHGERVLFVGCPCEVAAMVTLCPKPLLDRLYTIDLVCQGPTSEKAMRDFVVAIQHKFHARIANINMRYSIGPWIPQFLRIEFENGKVFLDRLYETPIGDAIRILQRTACYTCVFVEGNRFADITLGDYHGADKRRTYYHESGTSIALIHTAKGEELAEMLQNSAYLENADIGELTKYNPRISAPWPAKPERARFEAMLSTNGLLAASDSIISRKRWLLRKLPVKQREIAFKAVRYMKSAFKG